MNFMEISAASNNSADIPIMIHNIPRRTGENTLPSAVQILVKIETMKGGGGLK